MAAGASALPQNSAYRLLGSSIPAKRAQRDKKRRALFHVKREAPILTYPMRQSPARRLSTGRVKDLWAHSLENWGLAPFS